MASKSIVSSFEDCLMIEGNEGKDGVNEEEEDDEDDEKENDVENEIVSSFWGQQFPILFIKLIFNDNRNIKLYDITILKLCLSILPIRCHMK
jgi:hypothetical protein